MSFRGEKSEVRRYATRVNYVMVQARVIKAQQYGVFVSITLLLNLRKFIRIRDWMFADTQQHFFSVRDKIDATRRGCR